MAVPAGAVPNTVTLLPDPVESTAPTIGPVVTATGVATATCAAVGARSNTVSHCRVAVAVPVGRISVRHTLPHVPESGATWSVMENAALEGRRMVTEPANAPAVISKRC